MRRAVWRMTKPLKNIPKNIPIDLVLPVPPTDNRYYGRPKGSRHKYVTRAGRGYKHAVAVIAEQQKVRGLIGDARVAMKIVIHLPSGGDIQNRLKGLCDALEDAHIFENDKQIDDLRIIRGHPVKGGRCHVTIWEID
jgi:crossover junction endodeoxyribonuclease RusA